MESEGTGLFLDSDEFLYTMGNVITATATKLPANSPARKLLQYVRDEAHRFAQHYHHILRRKKLLNKK